MTNQNEPIKNNQEYRKGKKKYNVLLKNSIMILASTQYQ